MKDFLCTVMYTHKNQSNYKITKDPVLKCISGCGTQTAPPILRRGNAIWVSHPVDYRISF